MVDLDVCDAGGRKRVVREVGAQQDQQVGLVRGLVARRRSRAGRSCRRRTGCRTGSTPCRAARARPGPCTVSASAITSSCAPATPAPQNSVTRRAASTSVGERVDLLGAGRTAGRWRSTGALGRSGSAGSRAAMSPGRTSTDTPPRPTACWIAIRSSRGICSGWRPARCSGCTPRTAARGGSPGSSRCRSRCDGMCEASASTGRTGAVGVVQAVDQVQCCPARRSPRRPRAGR